MQQIQSLINRLESTYAKTEKPLKIAVAPQPKLEIVKNKHPVEESIIIASQKSKGRKYFVYFKQRYAADWTKAKEILHVKSDEEAKSHNIWWNFKHPDYIFSIVPIF